ncbi:MAG: hypothetical protein WCK08_15240 [Betaproteobacteria bacterium]
MLFAPLNLALRFVAVAVIGAAVCGSASPALAQSATAMALLAGQTPSEGVPANLNPTAWSAYSSAVQRNWKQYRSQIGEPMQAWAGKEIPVFQGTVFYPFSGPDFATVSQLFPQAKRYVMVAMQTAERPIDFPELKPEAARQTLEVLTGAWENYGRDGFFVTEYLDKYLHQNRVRIGAATFLSSFFQLKGLKVKSVTPIQISAAGEVEELPASDPQWRSVRFRIERAGEQVLVDYLRIDLSDKGLSATPQHHQFVRQMSSNPVLLKAASHLPQNNSFSMVAASLTSQAPFIIQDETGIKFGQLKENFGLTLYGKFERAHVAFGGYQRDLAKAFADGKDIQPLGFRVGYFKGGSYALIVAKRKS